VFRQRGSMRQAAVDTGSVCRLNRKPLRGRTVFNARLKLAAFALGLTVPSAARAAAEDPIISALDSRADEASTRRAIEALEVLAKKPGTHPLAVGSAILQARFFHAENFMRGDAQVEANKRNVADGLARISRLLGEKIEEFDDLDERLGQMTKSGVGLLFWTTLSFGRTIESMSVFSQAGAAKRFKRGLERVIALDPDYFHGVPHAALAKYLARAPGFMGGDSDRAKKSSEEAIRRAPGYADNYVNLAEVLKQIGAPSQDVQRALSTALGQAEDGPPGAGPEQRIARARATVLLRETQK
jgi:TRAP transporter TatT component family protein